LVTWKKDGQIGWQVYDAAGRPSEPTGSAESLGDGVAGILDKNGHLVLFR